MKLLWRGLNRTVESKDGQPDPVFARALETYDSISTDKAQTVLRYWNWSPTASLNPEVLKYIQNGVIPREEDFGAATITAALIFPHRE